MPTSSPREDLAIVQVAQRLHERFPAVPEARIQWTVQQQYHQFDNSRIRDFVPIFLERRAREALATQLAI